MAAGVEVTNNRDEHGDKSKARQGPCHFGCLTSAKRRAGKEVWMSTPTPSPWTNVPTGTTLCSRHYEQALTANRAHSVVRPSPATVKETKPDAIAGPPLNDGRRTALSDGHYSGGGGGGVSGGGEKHARRLFMGGEVSGGRGNAASDSPSGEVGQVVEGDQSRPWHSAKASGGPRQNAAAGFFPDS